MPCIDSITRKHHYHINLHQLKTKRSQAAHQRRNDEGMRPRDGVQRGRRMMMTEMRFELDNKQPSNLETIDTEWRTHGWLDVKSFNLLPAFW